MRGTGMQANFNAAGIGLIICANSKINKDLVHRIGDLGLKVNTSELDACAVGTSNPKKRMKVQPQIYHDMISAVLSEPAFDSIWLWGATDKHS